MSNVLSDLRYLWRLSRRSPTFTAVALLTLTLGIGANTTIFSVVNAVLMRPLPYHEPDRLFTLWEHQLQRPAERGDVSPANFVAWRAQNHSWSGVAAFTDAAFNLTGEGEPLRLSGHLVSGEFLDVLGGSLALGRSFDRHSETPGAARVAILSYRLWHSRFGADAAIIGRSILLNDAPYAVVGVTGSDFRFPGSESDILTPLIVDAQFSANHGDHFLDVIGRLSPRRMLADANADMGVVSRQLSSAFPDTNRDVGVLLVPIRDQIAGDARSRLLLMLSAVGCVLLVACANLASLLLARASARAREIGVRTALGADRRRIVRQLLTESVALALMGGVGGMAFAFAASRVLERTWPETLRLTNGVAIDGTVLAFTLGLSLASGIVFGLAPAIQMSLTRADFLRDFGRGALGAHGRTAFRSMLVVAEIAVTIVLLAAGGLMVRTLVTLRSIDPGFDASHTLTMRIAVSARRYPTVSRRAAAYEDMIDRTTAIPGVESAGVTTFLPLTFAGLNNIFTVNGRRAPEPGNEPLAAMRVVSSDYFKAMRIPIVDGRPFSSQDTEQSSQVVIVSAGLARRYWPDASAVGQQLRFGRAAGNGPWLTIVGVVGDVRQATLDTTAAPATYLPLRQAPGFIFAAPRDLIVRSASLSPDLARSVVNAVRIVDANMPVTDVRGLDDVVDAAVAERRAYRDLFAAFAVLALTVAAIGVYGVMSYSVEQRRPEIGVRLALGARQVDVIRLILGQAIGLAASGTAIGIAGSFFTNRLLGKLVYGVAATDARTLIAVAAIMIVTTVASACVPAMRAARVDPLKAVKAE